MKSFKTMLLGWLILGPICGASRGAMALDRPTGAVILTVTSPNLQHPNIDNTAQFDLKMLDALDGRSVEMSTPWTDGRPKFSGPFLRSVLKAAGAYGAFLSIKAINGYSATIPMSDATDLDTILATRINGVPIAIRDLGPLFLIYPFDEKPYLYNEKYFSRSVWQINSIEVGE